MRILHTSDWHLGRLLFQRKRYEEFQAFLDFLLETLKQQSIEALLIAGDVFDTGSPSHRAQQQYYRFLCQVAASGCRHVVVIAGNHDSPSFLQAPRELLQALNVHVVAQASENPADEVLLLRDSNGEVELIVCAVPYLRDRDIRLSRIDDSLEDKERKLLLGIRQHYARVCQYAEEQQAALLHPVPIVATGHLFTSGGQTQQDDGVRDLYVGSLAHVGADLFPACIDYLALGHLHIPQQVQGQAHLRYSGSPIAMGFGEARQQKSLCQVDLSIDILGQHHCRVELLPIPVFQALRQLRGDWPEIQQALAELVKSGASYWVELVYEGAEVIADLRQRVEDCVADSAVEIITIKDQRVIQRILGQSETQEDLAELSPNDIFERCLNAHDVPETQRAELRLVYQECLQHLAELDARAE